MNTTRTYPTPTMRNVARAVHDATGLDLGLWLSERYAAAGSWHRVALDIYDITGRQESPTPKTVQTWAQDLAT